MVLDSFLLGSLLGDGSFVKRSPFHNVYAVFKHSEDQYQYLTWKYEFLKQNGLIGERSKGIVKVNIKAGSCYANYQNQYKFATKSSEYLNYLKYLDEHDILSQFDEDALAVWILDDGSVSSSKVIKISPGVHSVSFCENIVEKLNKDFGLCAYLYQHPVNPMKNTINFRVRSYEQVRKLVLDRFPSDIDVVQSKFNTTPSESLVVRIKYFNDITPLTYVGGSYASNWIDLRAAEDVELKQGDFKLIPLGVAMQLPAGYEAHVIPRSSTFKNFGIIQANHMGMIDESYCGDNDQWHFPAIAMRNTVIHVGDRICQFRIVEHQPKLSFEAVDTLGNPDRGGFGTTGKR